MLWWEIELRQKKPPQAVQKEQSKVIHFQKFSQIGNTSDRVLLLVKFQALIRKWLYQGCFLGNNLELPGTPRHHRFWRLIFLVQKATICWCLTIILMKCIFHYISLQFPGFLYNNIVISMMKNVNSSYS